MRYRLYLSAYDIMDQVHVRVSLFDDHDIAEGAAERVAEFAVDVQGTGESDPWQWARDVLVAALEQT